MSYTNKTTHYELPQYVATDKPKYLTDFNDTMAAIDSQMYVNATAAATAQTAAEGAQSTADSAVSSIGTLNTQINGDPTDPSDTGLAGDVSNIDGNVNTIQSLLGSGSPTTSNQTVIGAINAIEGAIAPAEDSATLGASYVTGAQFARGGVVYEALTDLTSGTAFTSLTLNTDYKVADTLVGQISNLESSIGAITDNYAIENFHTVESFTAETDETFGALMARVHARMQALVSALSNDERIEFHACQVVGIGLMQSENIDVFNNTSTVGTCVYTGLRSSVTLDVNVLVFAEAAGTMKIASIDMSDSTITPTAIATTDSAASHSITTINLHYRKYKKL